MDNDDIEIYDQDGNHIGYGIKNEFGGYEIHNDNNEWIGTSDECGIGNSREVYDHHNNHLGYIDDPSAGFTDFHAASPKHNGNSSKSVSKTNKPASSSSVQDETVNQTIRYLSIPIFLIVIFFCFKWGIKYESFILMLVGLFLTLVMNATIEDIQIHKHKK